MTSTFIISGNDGKEIGIRVSGLDAEGVFNFLSEVDAYLYSVGEYNDEDDRVERLNGDEWLKKYCQESMVLK